jgi:Flp pilus assembly protein TadG
MRATRMIAGKNVRYRGAAIVEAAIVMTLLLMITLGVLGFGYLFLRVEQITGAARHGARLACVYSNNPPALTSQVQTQVGNLLTGVGLAGTGVGIPTGVNPGTGQPVTVTVTETGLDILNLRNVNFMGASNFRNTYTASVTMAKEGP